MKGLQKSGSLLKIRDIPVIRDGIENRMMWDLVRLFACHGPMSGVFVLAEFKLMTK